MFKMLLRQFCNLNLHHGAFTELVAHIEKINHTKKIQIDLEYYLYTRQSLCFLPVQH